jgi:splicing suppressor protein 51
MEKQKNTSTETQQSTSCTKDNTVKLLDVTPLAEECSKEANKEPSAKTHQNNSSETSQSTTEVTLSNLTSITKSQTQNYPLHMDLIEQDNLLYRNQKCLRSTSVMDQCPIQQDVGDRKNRDLEKKAHTLMATQGLMSEQQNSEQAAGPTTEISVQKKNVNGKVTKMENITEKLPGSTVSQERPQLAAIETTTNTNTDNRYPVNEVNKESMTRKHQIIDTNSLLLHENLSCIYSKTAAGNSGTEAYPTTAAILAPQLPAHKKRDPPSLTEKQSSPQITGLVNDDTNQKSVSPMNYTVEVQIKSDLIYNVGINIDLTASTEDDGISYNTAEKSSTYSGIPTKESKGSVGQEAEAEIGKVLSTMKVMQRSASIQDFDVCNNTSQAKCTCLECPPHNSSSHFHTVSSAQLSTEAPVHLSTTHGSENREEVDVSTNTVQSVQKPSATCNTAKFSELGKEVPVLSPTSNSEADEVSVTSNMTRNEALFVLKENNTAVRVQVCVQIKKAKQHTLLDTSLSKITPPCVSKPSEFTLQNNVGEPSTGPDASIKQTETQMKSPNGTKLYNTAHTQEVTEVLREKDDSAYKTQDNITLRIPKENLTKASKPSKSSKEMSAENDVQNLDMKLENENLTKVTKKSRCKGKSKYTDTTLDSKQKPQENKGKNRTLICESNQMFNSKECKVITHENKTVVSEKKANSINDDADQKSRIINAEEKNNTAILYTEESYNKVCKRNRESAKNKEIQTDMNSQSSDKLTNSCFPKGITQGFTNSQTNESKLVSGNEHADHQNENIQNSNDDLPVNENNTERIHGIAQQKTEKKCMGNIQNKSGYEENERDLREGYVASELCGHKDENLLSTMDPKPVQEQEDQIENSKSEDTLIRPNVNKSSKSYANKKVSTALSEQHLIHLARTEKSEMTFIPDVTDCLLAPESSNFNTTADEKAEWKYKLVQREVFLSYVCHVCKSLGYSCNLKKCSNCKLISYCSKEHQRQHWPAHRDLCKVISNICKRDRMTNLFQKAVGISPDEYRYYRIYYVNECAQQLGRDLDLWEKEMIYYPQVCHTCYEFDIQKLVTCQKCHHVSYCKPSHLKIDHDIWCKEFQVHRDFILYQFHHGIIQPSIPKWVRHHYTPLTGDTKTFMLNTVGVSNKSLLLNKLNLTALTDIATCPLTVLFSLQNCNFSLKEIKFLTIHLVGAEMQFEIDNLRKWELLLLHLIPSLRIMKVVFVGPKLNLDNAFLQRVDKNICRKCHTAGRKVVYDFWEGLYHDFFKSKDYKKPDLISAFNAGLYRLSDFEGKDTWSPSIEAMLKEPDIPVVITEYTEQEMPLDLQRIQSIVDSLEIIMSPARNPFASSKPSLNFFSDETVPVIFKNFYITILKRGKM